MSLESIPEECWFTIISQWLTPSDLASIQLTSKTLYNKTKHLLPGIDEWVPRNVEITPIKYANKMIGYVSNLSFSNMNTCSEYRDLIVENVNAPIYGNFKSLVITSSIKYCETINSLINLTYLDICNKFKSTTTININSLSRLKYVKLCNINITSISGLNEIETLNIKNCFNIYRLDNLPNITKLVIKNTNIRTIQLPSLQILHCKKSYIREIYNMTNLWYLNMHTQGIIYIAGCPNLRNLKMMNTTMRSDSELLRLDKLEFNIPCELKVMYAKSVKCYACGQIIDIVNLCTFMLIEYLIIYNSSIRNRIAHFGSTLIKYN